MRSRDGSPAADNPFLAIQESWSRSFVAGLDAWRDIRDAFQEQAFFAIYGQPLVQAQLGLKASDGDTDPLLVLFLFGIMIVLYHGEFEK